MLVIQVKYKFKTHREEMSETGESASSETVEQQSSIKNKRKQLRARITRSIKRIRESIQNEDKITMVDLFGPFSLKVSRNKSTKAWGAIFTCATVRAIHLEIVESPSAEAFLQAMRRFLTHHGWPSSVISENGKSFIGAETLLRELLTKERKQLEEFAVLHQLRWIFTTHLSPHQGEFTKA